MDEHTLRTALNGMPIPAIQYFDSLSSTNDFGLAWADEGAPDGALVAADTQTGGRGRLGRKWITLPGTALAFSLILRPRPEEIQHLVLFSPLGALALACALENLGLQPQIKWPNDVLLQRCKIAGILAEASWLGAHLQAVVVGIGVNVAPESVPPPETLLFPAVSIEAALGKPVNRLELLKILLHHLFAWREHLGTAEFLQAWSSRLAFRNEWVRVEQTGQSPLEGRLLDVEIDGSLSLAQMNGDKISITVGDVHLRPTEHTV